RQVPDPGDPYAVIEIARATVEDRMVNLLGYELLYGRAPRADESGVVAVNQSTARAVFGRDDVVGERFMAVSGGYEIVGVLKDLSFGHPLAMPRPYVFEPLNYLTPQAVVAAQLSAADLQLALERLVRDGVIERGTITVRSLEAIRAEVTAPDRVRGAFTVAAALLVVVLSGLGFYGTQRYLVASGRREYAIRASLGAGPGALGRLVM